MTVLDDPGAPDVLDMWRSVDDVDVDVDVPADSRFAVLVRPGRVLGLDLVREVGHRRQVTS
ncbi:hypothetical protein [Streptomyces sp. NPDC005262]|uniref:hypothetical protein n=1 Tax=Streptomyces sp. NPDC005262 TaxID=3364710 RepID=UPI0036964BD6